MPAGVDKSGYTKPDLLFYYSQSTISDDFLCKHSADGLYTASMEYCCVMWLMAVPASDAFLFHWDLGGDLNLQGHIQSIALRLSPVRANRQPDSGFLSLVFSYLSPTNGSGSTGEWGQEVAYRLCFYSLCGNFLIIGHTNSFHSPPWHFTPFV